MKLPYENVGFGILMLLCCCGLSQQDGISPAPSPNPLPSIVETTSDKTPVKTQVATTGFDKSKFTARMTCFAR